MAQTVSKTPTSVLGYNTVTGIVASGNTELLELPVRGLHQVFIQFAVTLQNLDAFVVEGKSAAPDAPYVTLESGITSTPVGIVVDASGTLATTAAGNSAWLVLNVRGMDSIRIQASAAVDGAAVTIHASGI